MGRVLAHAHVEIAAELDVGARPAMLVAMVTAPGLPACAMISASCSW